MVLSKPERLKEILVCADKLGVPRDSGMFINALEDIHTISPERIDAKLDCLKNALGCSEAELGIAVCKLPNILALTEDLLSHKVEYLKMVVGLEVQYIVHSPALLGYSMKRLMPRYYVLKVLKAKCFIKEDTDFYSVVSSTEKRFAERFLDHYKETVPCLASTYSAACEGRVPPEIQLCK